jgi:hypothetical protein
MLLWISKSLNASFTLEKSLTIKDLDQRMGNWEGKRTIGEMVAIQYGDSIMVRKLDQTDANINIVPYPNVDPNASR